MASLNSRTTGQNCGVSCTATTFAERSMIFCSEADRGGITLRCQTKLKGRSTEFSVSDLCGAYQALLRPFQALVFFIQKASDFCGQFDELVGILLGHYLLAERSPAFTIFGLHKRVPCGRNMALDKVSHKLGTFGQEKL